MSNEIIRKDSVNKIQDGLDNIVRNWGNSSGGSRGSRKVSQNEIASREIINTWISWLRFYANNIGANHLLNNINEIAPDTLLRKNLIDDIYARTVSIVNHCNRSECNKKECNKRESNKLECDRGGESNRWSESNRRSECNRSSERR